MNAKQFRLALALMAAAWLGYHMGSSDKQAPPPVASTDGKDSRAAAQSTDAKRKPEPVAKETTEPELEFSRQYEMDREVTDYSPWAQNSGYQFRPTERDWQQQPRRYQPNARYDRPFNGNTQNATNEARGYRDRAIDRRFRPLRQQREHIGEPRDYRPMASEYAAQFVHRL